MAQGFTTQGNRKVITVTTLAQLRAAYIVATGGTVIRQTAVDPDVTTINRTLTFALQKGRAGVSIEFHPQQTMRIILKPGRHNLELIYGRASADDVIGNAATATYAVEAESGASHFAIRGMVLGQSNKHFVADNCTDFEITDCLLEWTRVDSCQIVRCRRFTLARNYGRDTTIKSRKLRWFNDGRQPVDDANSDNATDAGPIGWADADHSDLFQIRNYDQSNIVTEDVAVLDNDVWMQGAGIVSFGNYSSDGFKVRRMLVAGNKIRCTDNRAVFMDGEDIEVRDNEVGTHPIAGRAGSGTLGITVIRRPDVAASRVRGGRNTLANTGYPDTPGVEPDGPLGFTDASNAAGMLGGPTITGDAVVAPAIPRLELGRLGWATKNITRPAFTAYTGVPVIAAEPRIYHTNQGAMKLQTRPAAVVGGWATGNLGKTKGNGSETYDVEWRRGGPTGQLLSTSRIYQFQQADVGVGVVYGVRPTNGNGPGVFAWSALETVVSA
jgi:hypothetical protein